MVTLKYRCKLLTDVILNQKSASEGANKTLDFIPGSNFLGIVAACYNQIKSEEAFDLFHSGKVRFGDAHLANGQNRTLKVAASFFKPKLNDNELYLHHAIADPTTEELRRKQLKQLRDGFYDFLQPKAIRVNTEKSFAIKSARDKELGTSKDAALFGYESLQAGSIMFFSVELDDCVAHLSEYVNKYLIGNKRVGRSRSAQYGYVEIKEDNGFAEICSTTKNCEIKLNGQAKKCTIVYAESRLIFLDECGVPKAIPDAQDLGFGEESQIIWEKSQIRSFQYSPWNYHRQCYDSDRYGIEKGSVFVVETKEGLSELKTYIGNYNNEGFGKVLYNPSFLEGKENGEAVVSFEKNQKHDTNMPITNDKDISVRLNAPMLKAIKKHVAEEAEKSVVYDIVNEIKNSWLYEGGDRYRFREERFASQWGRIRSIAMNAKNNADLESLLFASEKGYLEHGTAVKDKWKKYGRRDAVKSLFIKYSGNNLRLIIINLASEMAKLK